MLAAEPRLLVPRDIESKELVSCHVEVELCDTPWYKGRTLVLKAPVMLPELKYLKRVTIQDSRYHQVRRRLFVHSKKNLNQICFSEMNYSGDLNSKLVWYSVRVS